MPDPAPAAPAPAAPAAPAAAAPAPANVPPQTGVVPAAAAPAPAPAPAAPAPRRSMLSTEEPPKPGDKPADGAQPEGKTPEVKPGEKPVEGAKAEDAKPGDKPADEAPEPAAWKLEVPKDGPLKAEDVAAIEKLAKDAGMTEAQAKALVTREATSRTAQAQAQVQAREKLFETWEGEAKAKFGDKIPEMQGDAKRALTHPSLAKASEGLRKLLNESPIGNRAEVLEYLAAVGRQLREDAPPAGGQQAPAREKTMEERWFGKDHRVPSPGISAIS